MAIATVLVAGAPVYLNALERQGIDTAIDNTPGPLLAIAAFAPYVPLDESSLQRAETQLEETVTANIGDIYRGHERYVQSKGYDLGLARMPEGLDPEQGDPEGYLGHLGGLEEHAVFNRGRMASDAITPGPRGPVVEGVVDAYAAYNMSVRLGDTITLRQSLLNPTVVTVSVVGVFEPADVRDDFWQHYWVLLGDDQNLTLFVTRDALVEGLGRTYPGAISSSLWSIYVDAESLKGWSIPEGRERLADFRRDLSGKMDRATVVTGIERMFSDFEERSFFTRVPVLMMLVVMLVTVLYFIAMLVSYLVESRDREFALLRTRGAGTNQFLRVFSLEALVLTGFTVVAAPFLAMGIVAVSGLLPFFSGITEGSLLPVELHWTPFAASAGVGLLILAILVVPGMLGSRAGLVVHRLRSSRPPSVPLFHRYYVDVALLVLGGLAFWELRARGHIVSGGLFKDVHVNEMLLLAPVLVLVVVALLFMRLFPLFVRFLVGESPALMHVAAAAVLASLPLAIAARELSAGSNLSWLPAALLVALWGGVYWATHRTGDRWLHGAGLLLQALLVAAVVWLEPPDTGHVSFAPTVALMGMVPAQALFLALRLLARFAPAWLVVGLWRMGRNPLQYTWLVMLLVMVTGMGYLATTVGGTLSRSHEERVLYDVAADFRIGGLADTGRADALKERYLAIPGVTAAALSFRSDGRVGALGTGGRFDVFAVETSEFPYMSWYRDDFSVRPLVNVMQGLHYDVRYGPIEAPEGISELGVWVKPEDSYGGISLRLVVRDARGGHATLPMGTLETPEWQLKRAAIPRWLPRPLQVVSVQIFELGFGPVGTPGSIVLDDLHGVTPTGETVPLHGFEDLGAWVSLATSLISEDAVEPANSQARSGEGAARFSFGKETDRGIRGFYHSPSGGPLPVVVSASLLEAADLRLLDETVVTIEGRLLPVVIRGAVDYFPTLDPGRGGFVLAEFDSLTHMLNMVSTNSPVGPSEMFLSQAPGTNVGVRDFVLRAARSPYDVRDREHMLAEIRLDPLITAGWRAMVLLSLGIIGVTAGLGYATYLLSFAGRSRSEMGFLQAFGFTRRQILGLLSMEHLVVVVVGLGLGTWAGLQMSSSMVESVTVTDRGEQVLPPLILTTDWLAMSAVYLLLLAIFGFALYRLTRGMVSVDLQTAARMEI